MTFLLYTYSYVVSIVVVVVDVDDDCVVMMVTTSNGDYWPHWNYYKYLHYYRNDSQPNCWLQLVANLEHT